MSDLQGQEWKVPLTLRYLRPYVDWHLIKDLLDLHSSWFYDTKILCY